MNLNDRMIELMEQGEGFCLATVIRSDSPEITLGAKALFPPNRQVEMSGIPGRGDVLTPLAAKAMESGKPCCADLEEGVRVFLDVYPPLTRLLVCGAGHIALPLARFARETGFFPTVLDDRADYANVSRLPGCDVVAEDFTGALRRMPPKRFRYVVVITRGHAHDLECLLEVLRWDADYVGLIGSRRRIRIVKEELERRGFSRETLDERLFTPVGLDIGAESPEEIALAVAAELVCVRRMGTRHARVLREAGWGKP